MSLERSAENDGNMVNASIVKEIYISSWNLLITYATADECFTFWIIYWTDATVSIYTNILRRTSGS